MTRQDFRAISIEYGDVSNLSLLCDAGRAAFLEIHLEKPSRTVQVSWGVEDRDLLPFDHAVHRGDALRIRRYARPGDMKIKLAAVQSFMKSVHPLLGRILAGDKGAFAELEEGVEKLRWAARFDRSQTPEALLAAADEEWMSGAGWETNEKKPAEPAWKAEMDDFARSLGLEPDIFDEKPEVAAPVSASFEDLLRGATKYALEVFDVEFQRKMYRYDGPETRLGDDLWPRIVNLAGELLDEHMGKTEFTAQFDVMKLLQERPDLLFAAESDEAPATLVLTPGAIEDHVRDNVRVAVKEALDPEKIALLAHKRALRKGY